MRSRTHVAARARDVSQILDGYLLKGVFSGLARRFASPASECYEVIWHYGRPLRFRVDYRHRRITVENALPGVTGNSAMFRELRKFLSSFQTNQLPRHRRVDTRTGLLSCRSKAGEITIYLALRGENYRLGVRKLVHVIHELYLDFLPNGPYYEYQLKQLGLNPDALSNG